MAMRSIADVFAALKDSRFEDGWDALSVEDVLRHLIFEAGVFNVVEDLTQYWKKSMTGISLW